jgi:F420-dependent oxidoreductase-like protein
MRIGLMIGPERGRYAAKVDRMRKDARWAEEVGLSTVWIPQIPDEFDALTAVALTGAETSRIEIGTAVVPVQPRHPIALAQQVLSTQAVCEGRLTLGLGVSHHWVIDEMLGLPYEKQALTMRAYLDVLDQALAGPGTVTVDNELFHIDNPLDITDVTPTPVLIAALGPRMLRLAGERTDGTILWLADERAIESHIAPRITEAASAAGRPAPRVVAGVPVCLCGDDEVDAAVERTNRILAEADVSPNYQRLLDEGNARNVGDILAAGSETAIEKRLRAFADAGVTDVSVRVVPLGQGRDELLASLRRTRELLAHLAPTLA